MATMGRALRQRCEHAPDERRQAVLVLKRAPEAGRSLADMGLDDAETIPDQPEMLRLRATGARLLELTEHPEIEQIDEDLDVGPLRPGSAGRE